MTSTARPPSHRAEGGPPVELAVIGGGASGVLTALNVLVRSDDPRLRVTIHEASGIVGRGLAYGTSDQRHLLNVRARHMSALPDAPSDLLDWARRTGRSNDPQGFLPRADFAIYLQDRLSDVADHRLRVHGGRVEDVVPVADRDGDPTGFVLHAGDVETRATHVVLAHGNHRPRPLTVDGDDLPAAPWNADDPWDLGRLRMLPDDATVVIVGTGLTAVDTVITLLEEGPGRRVVMTSRHGMVPRAHIPQQSTAWVTRVPAGPLTADLLAETFAEQVAAARHQGVDWRAVVDGLRAPTHDIWRRLPLAERRVFLDRYARDWEVRRHRMAPEVAARLDRFRADGRLVVRSGTLTAVADRGATCAVTIGDDTAPIEAHAVVNCTGPLTDVTRSTDPLLLALRERGLIAPDPLRLGLDTTGAGEVVGEDGGVVPGLHAVGPARKGALWESTAIPEIRGQAAEVAAAVLGRLPACPSRAVDAAAATAG